MNIQVLLDAVGNGGDATVCMDLIEVLRSEGHTADLNAVAWSPELLKQRCEFRGLEVHLFDNPETASQAIKDRKSDLVSFHTSHTFPPYKRFTKVLAKAFPKNQLICTVHGPHPLSEQVATIRTRLTASLSVRHYHRIVVPSQHKVREWNHLFPKVSQVLQIPNPIRCPDSMDREQAKSELGLDPKRTTLGFVGRFNDEKRPQDLIEAASKLGRDVQLVFAGDGPTHNQCVELADRLKVNARFLGFRNDVATVYRSMDVFVFPSVFENFPIVLFQGAMCPIPVVASRIPVVVDELSSWPSVITYDAGSSDHLAEAISKSLDLDPDECSSRAEQVQAKYHPRTIANRYLGLIAEM